MTFTTPSTLVVLAALHRQLVDAGRPLRDAFVARMGTINPEHDALVATGSGAPADVLLDDVITAIGAAADIDALLALSTVCAARPGVATAVGAQGTAAHPPAGPHGDAASALDWALRDIRLAAYTAADRSAYAEATGLFVELVRRAALSSTLNRTENHT